MRHLSQFALTLCLGLSLLQTGGFFPSTVTAAAVQPQTTAEETLPATEETLPATEEVIVPAAYAASADPDNPTMLSFDQLTYTVNGTAMTYQAFCNIFTDHTYGDFYDNPQISVSYTCETGATIYQYQLLTFHYELLDASGQYVQTTNLSDPLNAGSYRLVLVPADNLAAVMTGYSPVTGYSYSYYILTGEPVYLAFTVSPKPITDADIIASSVKDQIYTGTPVYPHVSLQDSRACTFKALTPNVSYQSAWDSDDWYDDDLDTDDTVVYTPSYNESYDYTVEYLNHAKAGQATIRLTGVGNYTGTRDILFRVIVPVSMLTYSGYADTRYSGNAVTFPGFTASDGSSVLTQGQDYTLTYENNVKHGEASITVTGMGYYTGTTTLYFGIVPKKLTGIKASSPGYLQAKLTWKKCIGADGFEVSRYNTKTKRYEVIAIMHDGNWQVFKDTDTALKSKQYKYRIRPFVSGQASGARYYGAYATKVCKVTKTIKNSNTPIYTGDPDVDYAAEVICKKVLKKGMSQQKKVKALYDWVVDHCSHDKNYSKHKTVYSYAKNRKKANAYSKKIWKQIYTGKADCNFDGCSMTYDAECGDDYSLIYPKCGLVDGKGQFYRTYEAFQTHKGGCSYITRLFKALVNHAGMECTIIDGSYINRDGSSMYHYWCFIRANNKYSWYDVDVATSNKQARYYWYNKGTKFWKTCHSWNQQYNAKIPSSLKK